MHRLILKLKKMRALLSKGSYNVIFLKIIGYIFPSRLVFIGKSDIISFNGDRIEIKRKPKGFTFRRATLEDLNNLIKCSENTNNTFIENLYREYFAKGCYCFLIEYKGDTVGYAWAFFKSYILTYDDYKISKIHLSFNDDTAFLGDGYINPSYRLRGFFPVLMGGIIEFLNQNYNKNRFLGNIEISNELSLKSHLRLGFSKLLICNFSNMLGMQYLKITDREKKVHVYRLKKETKISI